VEISRIEVLPGSLPVGCTVNHSRTMCYHHIQLTYSIRRFKAKPIGCFAFAHNWLQI